MGTPNGACPQNPSIAVLAARGGPDEELAHALARRLAAGIAAPALILLDGLDQAWAQAVDRIAREADLVVPILSASSIANEALGYAVELLGESAETRGNGLRFTAVRVAPVGPLPPPLARSLDRAASFLWHGPADTPGVAEEILALAARPAAPVLPAPEPAGGAVPIESTFYAVRPADDEFRAAIDRRDSIILVHGPRQVGKTSLLARGLHLARASGARTVSTDLQSLNAEDLESLPALFVGFMQALIEQLGLDLTPRQEWDSDLSPNLNLRRFLRRHVLTPEAPPLVWCLDEVDRLFGQPFASEVFGLFRSWHNERALHPEGGWDRLTLAMAYATEAHLFITDLNQSPFNVGTRLALEDFTPEQIAELNRRYGSPLRSPAELERFGRLVGGQPFLVRSGLYELATRGATLDALEASSDRPETVFADHLRRLLISLARDPTLLAEMRGLLRGGACRSADSFFRLRAAGLLRGDSLETAAFRCGLYASYLKKHVG